MIKSIGLNDFSGKQVVFDVETDNIRCIHLYTLSGDDILEICYKNDERVIYDSSDCRFDSFYGGSVIYVTEEEIQKFFDEYSVDNK